MADEQKVTIDGVAYALDDLSQETRNKLMNLNICDQRIQQLQQDLAIAQTARSAYAMAVKKALPEAPAQEAE